MKRKEAVYKGLEFVPVWFTDTSLTSPDYFQITEFPNRLTAGKNLFKLRGHPNNLRVGGYLNIEVLDYNGDPIYHEVINYIDEDKSRVIAIYIYSETSPGDCTITLLAEAENAPQEWKGRANIKWMRTVPVNPNVSNVSEVIFETVPDLVVSEQVGAQLDRIYSGSIQFPTYTLGTVRYFSYNNQPAIEISNGLFTNDMSTGTITVTTPVNPTPTPTFSTSTTAYISTIKKILSPTLALLDTEYTVYSSQSISSHIYREFENSTFSLTYEATPDYVATQNSQSFALIQIKNLEPATGDVSRVKVFMNNKGTVGTWEMINDVELAETEIFVTNTASLFPDTSIGSFVTQSTIDTYWDAHTYQGFTETTPPTLIWTTSSLNNAMQIQNATDISAKNAVSVAQIKSAFAGTFIKGSEYKLTFDALGTRYNSNNPVVSFYMSGSAFNFDTTDYFNSELPVKLGKRIGDITVLTDNQRFDDTVISFEADNDGNAVLLVVIEEGNWQVADIRTTTDNDSGYSPNYTRIRTLVPTAHKSDNQLSFKAEYYNVNGEKSKQISYVYDKNWEGGNRYIDGDYSMLTGSLYVADSLETGVAISGYKNTGYVRSLGYSGFAAGFPGFLLWSGSALSGSLGTKGSTPYSGVGLELYGNTNNYFRFATNPSELDVHTETFFLGDPNSQYISGSNGQLEISSSGFLLTADGDVTASSFIAVNGNTVLFDSNNEYADALNIGRVIYYDPAEISTTAGTIDNGEANGITSSIFETFLLPGETRIQFSVMCEIDNTGAPGPSANPSLLIKHYISTGSLYDSSTAVSTYEVYNDESSIGSTTFSSTAAGVYSSGVLNANLVSSQIEDRQGMYCRIRSVIYMGTTAAYPTATIKLKGFVYRSSRSVGSSTIPPLNPIREPI
jgi:hypothetical protein